MKELRELNGERDQDPSKQWAACLLACVGLGACGAPQNATVPNVGDAAGAISGSATGVDAAFNDSPGRDSATVADAADSTLSANDAADSAPNESDPTVDAAATQSDAASPIVVDASSPFDARASGQGNVSDGGGICGWTGAGGPVNTSTTHLDIGVHDPSMIWDGAHYYLFVTGGFLNIRSSTDLMTWVGSGNVLTGIPGWMTTALGTTPPDLWAPDISYFGGQFHAYYAGTAKFGSNQSAIGLATSPTLDPKVAGYKWTDQGLVVQSMTSDNFNAIDPNLAFDADCNPWLTFGSFWSGIKLRRIDPQTGKASTLDTKIYSLASRVGDGPGAIEAPSIVYHGGYFYLFVSFDHCCSAPFTYRTMMGRATSITGPYMDKAGNDMMNDKAEQLLASSGRYAGPGGGTAWRNGSTYLYVYHYYDTLNNNASKLQIREIQFGTDGWVTLSDPLFP